MNISIKPGKFVINLLLKFLPRCFLKLDDSLEVASETAQKVNGVTNGSPTSPQDPLELVKSSGPKPQASSSFTEKSASKTGKLGLIIIFTTQLTVFYRERGHSFRVK